jgi:adenylate kinase family enzyme
MMELNELGYRICIIGPSSGGKSTLAQALGKRLDLEVCHLDQLAHIPNTNWQARDKELLEQDHREFLRNHDQWIIEGNYSFLMKPRFAEATSIIWLDFNVWGSLIRYLKRTLRKEESRPGNLPGATQQFSWELIHYMLLLAPKKRKTYRILTEQSQVKTLRLRSFNQLKTYYQYWELEKESLM